MSITLRIIQRFEHSHQKEFLELERKFAEMERRRNDLVKGKRLRPISGPEPTNTLIWEAEFPDIAAARDWLVANAQDTEHEELYEQQEPFFESVRIEFYENLDY
jgi:hypothetical protein